MIVPSPPAPGSVLIQHLKTQTQPVSLFHAHGHVKIESFLSFTVEAVTHCSLKIFVNSFTKVIAERMLAFHAWM